MSNLCTPGIMSVNKASDNAPIPPDIAKVIIHRFASFSLGWVINRIMANSKLKTKINNILSAGQKV
ncbi:hypothetical protein [Priestia aryabhattai]